MLSAIAIADLAAIGKRDALRVNAARRLAEIETQEIVYRVIRTGELLWLDVKSKTLKRADGSAYDGADQRMMRELRHPEREASLRQEVRELREILEENENGKSRPGC